MSKRCLIFFFLQGVEISEVVNSGPGLVFITYPEVVLKLPGGPVWAITFFVMLVVSPFFVLLDSQKLVFGGLKMMPPFEFGNNRPQI